MVTANPAVGANGFFGKSGLALLIVCRAAASASGIFPERFGVASSAGLAVVLLCAGRRLGFAWFPFCSP